MHKINEICKDGKSLPLSTEGNLRVVFLGVGSAFTKRNRQSNFLIIQEDHHVLVDCGTLGSLALDDVGLSVSEVQCYLPTHSHADHIGGFEEVALVTRYLSNSSNKPKMVIPKDYQDLLARGVLLQINWLSLIGYYSLEIKKDSYICSRCQEVIEILDI